ncbi:ABC transporter permease [Blastococcus sp. CT_GayMR16]|nr:ABC transporter permease [Blastococcus sp. CT_GayMR16]
MSVTGTGAQAGTEERAADERLTARGPLRRLLVTPELGALVGAVVVFAFFAVQSPVFRSARGIANWMDPASTLGIMAVAVALLMIGGHFDLSAGVLTGTTALTVGIVAVEFRQNLWVAIGVSLLIALAVGFFNGWLVTRTGLPSFIITLGTFLMLQGLNVGLTKLFTNTVTVGGIDDVPGYAAAEWIFASRLSIAGTEFRVAILWWLLFTALATWVLLRTRFGNWVFATGGDEVAARNVGVPARRTTITLFMTTAAAAWFVGTTLAVRLTSVQANTGVGQELIYIVAAVIGGCLLTGGFGSAIGASLGALIFGMTQLGIPYLHWDADWFYFFLGAMLLLAVLANRLVRRYAEAARR